MTFTEWDSHLELIKGFVAQRWPDVALYIHKSSLTIKMVEVMTGDVSLQLSPQEDNCMVPRVSVGSSGGLPSPLELAQAKLNDMARVLEALHFANGKCAGIRVFRDGQCPCARCDTRGDVRGTPCDGCEGKGTR